MIEACVVVQGAVGSRVVERVLQARGVHRLEIAKGADRFDAIGYASTLRWGCQRPTALVLDADTVEETSLDAQRTTVRELLGPPAKELPGELILAVPQVEAVLFADRAGLERALGRKIADEDFFEARFRPRAVFQRLVGKRNAEARALAVVDALDDAALRCMARHPIIREIAEFVEEVSRSEDQARPAAARATG